MNFNSKKTSLLILGITAIVLSRAMFSFFNDPEGPNLLVVMGMAAIIYVLSLAMYLYGLRTMGTKKLLLAIVTQIIIVFGFYFYLR